MPDRSEPALDPYIALKAIRLAADHHAEQRHRPGRGCVEDGNASRRRLCEADLHEPIAPSEIDEIGAGDSYAVWFQVTWTRFLER